MSASKKPPVPASVYLVADNLDAVLAAGEDLLALTHRERRRERSAARGGGRPRDSPTRSALSK